VDVDALCDGTDVFVAGVLEHIEEAGVHSGDSACSMPPFSLSAETVEELKRQTVKMALALNVRGLMNVQFAIEEPHSANPRIYVLEVNPRASRTVPFVAKTIGQPVAAIAAKIMAGETLKPASAWSTSPTTTSRSRKRSSRSPASPASTPSSARKCARPARSWAWTGSARARPTCRPAFARAFAKSQLGGGVTLPLEGTAFVSVKESDRPWIVEPVRLLQKAGFKVISTVGTRGYLAEQGVEVELVKKVLEGRPNIVDVMKNGGVQLVFNTTEGKQALEDSFDIRRTALMMKVPYYTTSAGALAAAQAIATSPAAALEVRPLQSYS
jgi:carbamoyl-phosphate synthase large subunit